MQAIEPVAYGALGLHPWELRRYTMRELGARIDGYRAVQRDERMRLAELACWLLGPYMKEGRRLTPRELLGLERREEL